VWLSQKLMAELFQTTPQNINTHLKNIFSEGEIVADSVIKESLITQMHIYFLPRQPTSSILQFLDAESAV
jgi:hypothetical protein